LGSESGLTALGGGPGRNSGGDDTAGEARPGIIVLTAYDYPQYADAALRLGAAGFVLKTAPIPELVDAIRRVASGGLAFSVRPGGRSITRLSPREHDVVRLVAAGRTNDEIGAELGIGAKTVETHLARLFDRLGIASRTELAMRAVREGWLDVPPSIS
jgi:DNA-binding NarL/FixJ family response regulator